MVGDTMLERVRAEFREMPGLGLTMAQAMRLFGLDRASCEMALATLLQEGWLSLKSDGTYARRPDGDVYATLRATKADPGLQEHAARAS
jgi:hypothetical protein